MRVPILLAFLGTLLSCPPTKVEGKGTPVFAATPAPVGPRNPRNSEAAIIQCKDGSLLLGWTEFYAGSGADHGPARISGRISTDAGLTWGDKYTLVHSRETSPFRRLRLARRACFAGPPHARDLKPSGKRAFAAATIRSSTTGANRVGQA